MNFHDIEEQSKQNQNFRKVLYTGEKSQLVLMSVLPGQEIGEEVHHGIDQIIVITDGHAKTIVNDQEDFVEEDDVIFVPAEIRHNVINTGDEALKLYTIYAPPAHGDGEIVATKGEA